MPIEQQTASYSAPNRVLVYETDHPYTGRSVCVETPGESRYYSLGADESESPVHFIHSHGEGAEAKELVIKEFTSYDDDDEAIGLAIEHHSGIVYVDYREYTFTSTPLATLMHGHSKTICHYKHGRRLR